MIICLFPDPLRLWSMLRVLLFVVQAPSRRDILHQLGKSGR